MLIIAYVLGEWISRNSYVRIFICEKKETSAKFPTNTYTKLVSQNELIVDHYYFTYLCNSNTLPKLALKGRIKIFEDGGHDQNFT